MNKKAERGLATRQGILETATRLFAEHGYAGVSIETVLTECGVSRGALYHHFAGKEALFEAVFEALEVDLCAQVIARSAGARDALRGLAAGGEAFLDIAQEPAMRQIVLIDAPSVLGWDRWREIETKYGFGLMKASLGRAADEGALPAEMVDIYAHMLLASLSEVALVIARADDREAATAQGKTAMATMLGRLLGSPT
ncbi:MAG TPA: TetR/AcrR family transcriptional regulator [Caulobacteraceae bacterium]|nr:TetR/AcrR family transcriptional regulator [Caulobacteraceae bacterium]